MQAQSTLIPNQSSAQTKASWHKAYLRFLRSGDENMLLKIAPLAMMGVLPLELIANLVPVVGEVGDVSYIIALIVIVGRTAHRVSKYR